MLVMYQLNLDGNDSRIFINTWTLPLCILLNQIYKRLEKVYNE